MDFKPPGPFKVDSCANISQAWRDYKQEFELYLMAAGKTEQGEEQKVAILLCCMGREHIKTYNNFTFAEDGHKKVLAQVLLKFGTHFEPKKLVKKYITQFQQREQGEHESVSQYITAVQELASQCEFGALLDRQTAVQISNGVRDQSLREKLWEDDLSLQDVLRKCTAFEQARATRKLVTAAEATVHTVSTASSASSQQSRGRGRGQWRGRGRSRGRGSSSSRWAGAGNSRNTDQQTFKQSSNQAHAQTARDKPACRKCASRHKYGQCPAHFLRCHYCNDVGHFAKCCRKKSVMCNQAQLENATDDMQCYDVNVESLNIYMTYKTPASVENNMWSVIFNTTTGDLINFKIDTAAECTVITKQVYDSMGQKPILQKSNIVICGFGGASVKSLGTVNLPVLHKGNVETIACEIVDRNVPNVLSHKDSVRLQLVCRVNNVGQVKGDKARKATELQSDTPSSAKDLYNEYADVTKGLGKIPGTYSLKIDPESTPVAHPPRPIPAALRESAKKKLDELESYDIIEKVPVGVPTPWCSSLHIVTKKNGTDIRITIDPKDLNKALLREYHPMSTLEDVTTRTSGSQYFTVLDANSGYFQIELDSESSNLTAFNTPFGRYRYKRLPMGISPAPEVYQRAMNDIFGQSEGVEIIMDDILVHASTLKLHNERLKNVLETCRSQNLKLNAKKTKLCTNEVEYIGHLLTDKGIKISDEKVRAVVEMPEPSSIKNVQTLLGMVTYTCKFLPGLSSVTEPLRQLIKDSNNPGFEFHFDEPHKEAFRELKKLMSTAPVLKYYSLTEPVTISCDASQSGLGAVLMHNSSPVAYASKALTTTEYAYAQIEKELLAIVFAFRKFHTYVYGRSDVTVETDHLPLVRIFEKPLHQVPLRLQKMRLRLQQYSFKLVGKSGKDIPVADALSRAYIPDTCQDLVDDPHEFQVLSTEVRSISAFSEKRQEQLVQATKNDAVLQRLIAMVNSQAGWPEHKWQLESDLKPFHCCKEEIAVVGGIVFKGDRVVIPDSMRKDMLDIIHDSHLGIVKCKQLARDILYWPKMNQQIEEIVSKCSVCQRHRHYQPKEPLKHSEVPTTPWSVVATDLFDCLGSKYVVVVDYYSEFFEIEKLEPDSTSATVIENISKIFSVHGIPDKVISDNGPQYSGHEFSKFASDFGFHHCTSSPLYPQANGMAEKAVQTAKRLLKKCDEDNKSFYLALLNLRNSPRDEVTGSPAQRLFGRRTRTRLPTTSALLKPMAKQPSVVADRLTQYRETAKKYYDVGAKELVKLQTGDTVRVRTADKQWQPAELLPSSEQPTQPRSYNVRVPSGRVWRRNRRDLLKTQENKIYHRAPDICIDHEHVQEPRSMPYPIPTQDVVSSNSPPVHKPVTSTRSGRIVNKPRYFDDFVT